MAEQTRKFENSSLQTLKQVRYNAETCIKAELGVPFVAQWLTIRLGTMRLPVRSPASLGSGIAVSCGVGRRCGLDSVLLWLWHRLDGTAPIRPLAGEPPYAAGAAQEMAKRQKKKKKKKKVQLLFRK